MNLKFDENIIRVNEQEKEFISSISSGKTLYTYIFEKNIFGKSDLDEFQQIIDKYKNEYLNEIDDDNNVIRKFKITNSSYSYSSVSDDENTRYHFTIEITEHEDLTTSILTIVDVPCTVLTYNEEIDQLTGAIIIDVVIKQTHEDRERINENIAKNIYFNVVRNDISDKVLRMRYGKTIWSEHNDFIKRKIVLVQDNYDNDKKKTKPLRINEPEITNIQKCLARQIRYTDVLENLLISKGIISTEEIDVVKSQVEDTYINYYKNFNQVNDVETYD